MVSKYKGTYTSLDIMQMISVIKITEINSKNIIHHCFVLFQTNYYFLIDIICPDGDKFDGGLGALAGCLGIEICYNGFVHFGNKKWKKMIVKNTTDAVDITYDKSDHVQIHKDLDIENLKERKT